MNSNEKMEKGCVYYQEKKSYRVYFWGKIYLILCLQLINQFVVIDIYFFNVKDFEFEYQLSL